MVKEISMSYFWYVGIGFKVTHEEAIGRPETSGAQKKEQINLKALEKQANEVISHKLENSTKNIHQY